MKDTYVICANITQENNTITGYLATNNASGGYPYFSTTINNSEIRTFESIEAARKFIETDLKRCEKGFEGKEPSYKEWIRYDNTGEPVKECGFHYGTFYFHPIYDKE